MILPKKKKKKKKRIQLFLVVHPWKAFPSRIWKGPRAETAS
jgi:hypothetical protein